jgi:two-component system OmpR family response regulator
LSAGPATGNFDLLRLDLMLPDANGLDLCSWVGSTSSLPIIMLTAQGDPGSRIVGPELGELGADDHLPKPFEPRELVARISAVPGPGAAPPPCSRAGRRRGSASRAGSSTA